MTEQAIQAVASPQEESDLSQDGQALLLLAFVLAQSGRHRQALDVLEGLRQLEAQSMAPLPLLVRCYLELGLFAEALPLAQQLKQAWVGEGAKQGMQEGAQRLCAARMVAEALWGLQRKEEARALLAQAVEEGNAFADA